MSRYEDIKRRVEGRQRIADRAAGVVEHLEKELKDEFGTSNLVEIKALLIEAEHDLKVNESKYNKALDEFDAEWPEKTG